MKIKVGVPFAKHGRITEETLHSVNQLATCKDFQVEVVAQQGSNIPRARNAMINGEKSNLIRQTLSGFDFYLCVDADTGFTPDNVRQLLAHDLDIVSGACPQKQAPDHFAAGWFGEVEGISLNSDRVSVDKTGLIEVDWAGAGFLLVKREALESMDYPWFTSREIFFESEQGPCAQLISEDLGFCMKAKQAGKKIMLDADCRVDHVVHPNEQAGSLSGAINDLLRNRETIIRHVRTMTDENKKLRQLLSGKKAAEKD